MRVIAQLPDAGVPSWAARIGLPFGLQTARRYRVELLWAAFAAAIIFSA